MTLKILFIGDPVAELKPGRETTLALIFEAQRRDMNVDYCTAKDLCLTNGKVIGRVQSITLNDNLNDHIHTAAARMQNLAAYDIIVLRSNPAGYARIDTSYVLDILADKVLIVNDPRGIREMHGKYFISQLPDFIVPYAFVEHPEHLKVFMKFIQNMGTARLLCSLSSPMPLRVIKGSFYLTGYRFAQCYAYQLTKTAWPTLPRAPAHKNVK